MSYWLAASPSSSLSQLGFSLSLSLSFLSLSSQIHFSSLLFSLSEKKSLPVHEPGFLNDVKKLRIRVFDLVGDYRTLSIFPESSARFFFIIILGGFVLYFYYYYYYYLWERINLVKEKKKRKLINKVNKNKVKNEIK